jgi:hypothetical protein
LQAYAKLYGSYAALEGGFIDVALCAAVPGSVGSIIQLDESAVRDDIRSGSLWRRLLQGAASGYLLGAASPGTSDSDISPDGIVQRHAYSLLAVREASDARGTHQLLKLKNPWARTEWKGKWADTDRDSWSKRMRTLLEHDPETSGDDGIVRGWRRTLVALLAGRAIGCAMLGDARRGGRAQRQWHGPTNRLWLGRVHVPQTGCCKHCTCAMRMLHPRCPGRRRPPPALLQFWMCFADFTAAFSMVFVCRPFKTVAEGGKWQRYVATGGWRGDTAGGCTNHPDTCGKNPQYCLQVATPANVCIVLQQYSDDGVLGRENVSIGIAVRAGPCVKSRTTIGRQAMRSGAALAARTTTCGQAMRCGAAVAARVLPPGQAMRCGAALAAMPVCHGGTSTACARANTRRLPLTWRRDRAGGKQGRQAREDHSTR